MSTLLERNLVAALVVAFASACNCGTGGPGDGHINAFWKFIPWPHSGAACLAIKYGPREDYEAHREGKPGVPC